MYPYEERYVCIPICLGEKQLRAFGVRRNIHAIKKCFTRNIQRWHMDKRPCHRAMSALPEYVWFHPYIATSLSCSRNLQSPLLQNADTVVQVLCVPEQQREGADRRSIVPYGSLGLFFLHASSILVRKKTETNFLEKISWRQQSIWQNLLKKGHANSCLSCTDVFLGPPDPKSATSWQSPLHPGCCGCSKSSARRCEHYLFTNPWSHYLPS